MDRPIIYARVSTKQQSEKEQIPQIIKTFNLPADTPVLKEEVSAWNIDKIEKRTELQLLIKTIKTRQITHLYVWHIDRLYRNRKKMREFMDLCEYYKVKVYSAQQLWLNDFQELKEQFPENFKFLIENIYNLMLDVYAQTAEDESRTKSERVKLKVTKDKEGITRSTKTGKRWGRKKVSKKVEEEIIEYYNQGRSMRWISEHVYRINKQNNKVHVSLGLVHKTIEGTR